MEAMMSAPVCECEHTGAQRLVDDFGDCAHCGRQANVIECPMCASPVATVLGRMAHRQWLRCRACGTDYSVTGELI